MFNGGLVVSNVKHIDTHKISDRQLIYFDLNVHHEILARSYKTFRDCKNFSIEQFQHDLCRTDWREFYGSRDVEMVSCLNNIILQLFDTHAPKVTRGYIILEKQKDSARRLSLEMLHIKKGKEFENIRRDIQNFNQFMLSFDKRACPLLLFVM